jgi:hypothetical protein
MAFRRRPREPPSTGTFNRAGRRRQPIDPPPSFPVPQREEPAIQLTGRQLEILRRKQGGIDNHGLHHLDPNEENVPPHVYPSSQEELEKGRHANENTRSVPSFEVDENQHLVAAQAEIARRETHQHLTSAPSKVSVASQDVSSIKSDRPFTTRSNKGGGSKNLALALASNKLSMDSRTSTTRSSVFRRRMTSSDNDTITSVTSAKSAATTKGNLTKASGQSAVSASDHDKAALRKLLGTTSAEVVEPVSTAPKPKAANFSSPMKRAIPPPDNASMQSSNVPAPTADDKFDQMEYLRHLISARASTQKHLSSPKMNASVDAAALGRPTAKKQHALSSVREDKVETHLPSDSMLSTGSRAPATLKTTASSFTSSSLDQKAILRKVLAKTMHKRGKEKLKLSPKGLACKSPKHDNVRMENAAVFLSRKVLSEQSKSKSPKKGLNIKGYVRSKIGLSRKPSPGTKTPMVAESWNPYDSYLAKSSSGESADSTRHAADRSLSQMGSPSSDACDDDKTRTTTSSSQMSESTHRTHEHSLKRLTANATIDTDESSTIMGNLKSASSDSMQYSSEEDNSLKEQRAFKAVDKLSQGHSSRQLLSNGIHGDRIDNELQDAYVDEDQQQNGEYNDFVKALQTEASGAHSQVRTLVMLFVCQSQQLHI